LDAKLRSELRVALKEILSALNSTTVLVTHDQDEAMSLADEIVVMREGRVMQKGSPQDIYNRPENKFVAEFMGRVNWFPGNFDSRIDQDNSVFRAHDSTIVARTPTQPGKVMEIGIRPE